MVCTLYQNNNSISLNIDTITEQFNANRGNYLNIVIRDPQKIALIKDIPALTQQLANYTNCDKVIVINEENEEILKSNFYNSFIHLNKVYSSEKDKAEILINIGHTTNENN